jgi:hypothetical protein
MKKVFKKRFSLQSFLSLFTLIVGTNYFLSYRLLNGFFKICGIDNLAIITIDDLTYLFAEYNLSIVSFTSLGFIGIFLIDLYSSSNENPVDNISKNFKIFLNDLKQYNWVKIIFIFLFLLGIILSYYIYSQIITFPNPILILSYLVILFVIPFLYYLLPDMRKIIFGIQIFLMFTWANQFITHILEETKNTNPVNNTEISFIYENQKVQTNDTLNFVIQSYKFTILRDSMNNYYFYDNSLIKNFKYRIKK